MNSIFRTSSGIKKDCLVALHVWGRVAGCAVTMTPTSSRSRLIELVESNQLIKDKNNQSKSLLLHEYHAHVLCSNVSFVAHSACKSNQMALAEIGILTL